jgi:undecaprenyl-diphosphatase
MDIPASVVLRRAALGAAAVLLLMLFAGLVMLVLVEGTSIGRAELDATRWISEHRLGGLDSLARVGSSLTDTFTVLGVLVGAVAMLAAAGHFRHGMVLLIAVTTEFLVFLTTSLIIGRERPDVEPLGAVPSTASFPSGHFAVAIALYGGLTLVATSLTGDRRVGRVGAALTAFIAVYVGLSRVYEGVHHPSDVIGGALLGIAALAAAGWSTGPLAPRARAHGPAARDDDARAPARSGALS